LQTIQRARNFSRIVEPFFGDNGKETPFSHS
jgi:hypothetical protein